MNYKEGLRTGLLGGQATVHSVNEEQEGRTILTLKFDFIRPINPQRREFPFQFYNCTIHILVVK